MQNKLIYTKDNYLRIDKSLVDKESLKATLTTINPEWISYTNFPTRNNDNIPKQYIQFCREDEDIIVIPREFNVKDYLKHPFEQYRIEDKTSIGDGIDITSKIKLKPEQVPAVDTMIEKMGGVLSFPCGCGKTVMALETIARIKRRTIILVHTTVLMNQWKDRIQEFLGLTEDEIGTIGNGLCDYLDKKITIGMVQTLLVSSNLPKDIFKYFGVIVADEVHRHGSSEWSKIIHKFYARVRFGLTATPKRSDNMEKVIFWAIGNVIYRGENHALVPKIVPVRSETYFDADVLKFWGMNKISLVKVISKLIKDNDRNKLIIEKLLDAANKGRKILLLSDRIKHLETLIEAFNKEKASHITSTLFIGAMDEEQRREAIKADVLFATQHIAKEGLDIPALDTLFMVTPFAGANRAQQSVGRILRKCHGKQDPLVIDIVDIKIDFLKYLWFKRKKAYDLMLQDNGVTT